MGWNCIAYKSCWLRDHFLLVARSDHTTGSRNIKPELVFKVHKMARYASLCHIMGPFKGEVPVFCRLTLAGPAILGLALGLVLRWAVRSAIIATAELIVNFYVRTIWRSG